MLVKRLYSQFFHLQLVTLKTISLNVWLREKGKLNKKINKISMVKFKVQRIE